MLHVNTELNKVKPKGLPETHTQTEISEGLTEVEPHHIKLPKRKVKRHTKKRKELRAELYGIIERFGDILLNWENDDDNSCKLNLHHGQAEWPVEMVLIVWPPEFFLFLGVGGPPYVSPMICVRGPYTLKEGP